MKKILLMGRSGCGKTTLTQALRGEKIHYHKTQYINHFDVIIDTPGEYVEDPWLACALAIYTYEADVVGLLISSCEDLNPFSPCMAANINRPVIGVVTQIDRPDGRPDRAESWLRLAGCKKIFFVSSTDGDGVWQILDYLRDPGDVMPWEEDAAKEKAEQDVRGSDRSSVENARVGSVSVSPAPKTEKN